MKKYLFCIFTFVSFFFLFSFNRIEAKSETRDNVKISFGDEDVLNLGYSKINQFKIRKDNSFYYDGVKYQFNSDFSLINDSIVVNNNSFTMNNDVFSVDLSKNVITSEKTYETYTLFVDVELLNGNSKRYTFKQEVCYTLDSVIHCNQDNQDFFQFDTSETYGFYYDFFPFYDPNIRFEKIGYTFTIVSDSDSISYNELSFLEDEINYKDYFVTAGYYNVTFNNSKSFIEARNYQDDTSLLYTDVQFAPGIRGLTSRKYKLEFVVCIGEDYSDCYEYPVFYKTNMDTSIMSYTLDLANIYYDIDSEKLYDRETKSVEIDSFKLYGTYVCVNEANSDCSDSRAQTNVTKTNEYIYYFNLSVPKLEKSLNGVKITCGYSTCLGVSGSVTNEISVSDDNGIEEIYWALSKEILSLDEINTSIENNTSITIGEGLEGYYYLLFKVKDGSGTVSRGVYEYLFDNSAPIMETNNFNDYHSDTSYRNVSINASFEDNYFSVSTVYFKVIKVSQEASLEKEDITSLYTSSIKMEEYIDEDGNYKVCFVAKDYLENYSDIICSNSYYLDISALTKEEVSVSEGNSVSLKSVNINIDINGVDEDVSFKCGLISKSTLVDSDSALTVTCYNKKDNVLTVDNQEGEYHLWIYASDYVGNYNLIKLDEIYLIDNKAPVIEYEIIGNNQEYSNSVLLDVDYHDFTPVDEESLKYVFYLKSYKESEFISFDLDEKIEYPFDYYGKYKIAIKACDKLNNCHVLADDTTFLIDTSKITISLYGEEEVVILRWSNYEEFGASSSKGNGGKYPVSVDYRIEGTVDVNKVGEYLITYTSGEGKNKVSITRKVIVKDSLPYIISLIILVVMGETIILLRLFIKEKKNDSIK